MSMLSPKHYFWRWLLLCLAGLAGALAAGGRAAEVSPWFVRAWQTDDGLPDNDVTGIVQAEDGYLWVATQGGLARFDGVRFQAVDIATPSQRTRPLIRALLAGQGQTLWLAMEGGLVIGLAASHTSIFSLADGLPNFRPLSLAQARDGEVWVGYADGSACRIARGKVTRYTARTGLPGVGPCVLASDAQGSIWLAKAGVLSRFQNEALVAVADLPPGTVRLGRGRASGLWVAVDNQLFKAETGQPLAKVAAIASPAAGLAPAAVYEDQAGGVWLGTLAGGLYQLQAGRLAPVAGTYPDIISMTEDREANLWTGTGGGGLQRLTRRVMELQTTEQGLPYANVRSLAADTDGHLWAAAQNGELARYQAGRWENLSTQAPWNGVRATCVTVDGRDGMWVGTARNGLRHAVGRQVTVLDRAEGLGGDIVRALLADREGRLWLALESPSRVQCYQNGTFATLPLPAGVRTARALAQDRAGTIWLGTLDGYLLRVAGQTLVDATPRTPPRSKPIRCLYADPAGDLWIGYAGAGVGRLHAGKFASLNTSQGLHDAYICAMTGDDYDGFWFCSDHGIFQIRQRELAAALEGQVTGVRSVLYGRDESLPNLQGNFGYSPGGGRMADGRIWFPTHSGLVVIDPRQSAPNHLPPPVRIETVLVDGQPLARRDGQPVTIPPQHHRIDVAFTALSFSAPENVAFRYRLAGWDENWLDAPRGQRSVAYTHLAAGDYVFQVIACNNAGLWNETGDTLAFTVNPFWWETWWFRLGAAVGLIVAVATVVRYISYRRLREQLQKLEQETLLQTERARIAKDLHDELGASLTQISLLGKLTQHDLADPGKAGPQVAKIAALARQGIKAVDEIVWAVSPRNDNLSQLLDYAGQYAVDFLSAANIRCRIDFPASVPEHPLTAEIRHGLFLAVKEALHNVVKHSRASECLLTARCAYDRLELVIADNGAGFADREVPAGQADGLRNMRLRVADLGGQWTCESQPGAGTRIKMDVALTR